MDLKQRIATDLLDAHARTDALLAPLDDQRLRVQHDPIMSPLVWDYGHVAVYQELWLVQQLSGTAPMDEARMHHYDAFENPRRVRASLPLLSRSEVAAYRTAVDERSLSLLAEADVDGNPDPLLRHGFVYDMIVEHEHQHSETMLQTLQLVDGGYGVALPTLPEPSRVLLQLDAVAIPAGRYPIGSDEHAPYDNEHPTTWVDLAGFRIDRFPVTSGQYAAFVDDGGYTREGLWSAEGWAWRVEAGVEAPKHWHRDGPGGAWWTERFGHRVPVDMRTPVMHVCWHEAQAYCRWAGRRLPTEMEWEVAATWDPATRHQRRHPWGDQPPTARCANLDQRLYGAAPVGAYPDGASALGCEQMIGDVWEWTASDFLPYPGFNAFPYREYSEVFFGSEYKVLRGASWAARASVGRATFRNWDYPIRRQIFAGFRCADDGGRT
ncbi:MAG TPA: ergothioneine biosynthesis protein EgtB [Candidatus Angelobacter sp.]|jgi:iron(II)-dependent oxidoreductase|nr:ergothioneine biosynthesis protein EgtB [Candidatus Angelobacter sp.]